MIEICTLPLVHTKTMWQYTENIQVKFYFLTLARRKALTNIFIWCRMEYKLNKQLPSTEKLIPACHLRGSAVTVSQDILSLSKPLPTQSPTSFGFSAGCVPNVQAPQHPGRVILSHFTPKTPVKLFSLQSLVSRSCRSVKALPSCIPSCPHALQSNRSLSLLSLLSLLCPRHGNFHAASILQGPPTPNCWQHLLDTVHFPKSNGAAFSDLSFSSHSSFVPLTRHSPA